MSAEVHQEGANPLPNGDIRFHNFGRANTPTGYDVRFQLGPDDSPENFTIGGGHLPSPEIADSMYTAFEEGENKSFDNIPYPVSILHSDFFHCESDAIGNKVWKAKVYIANHHSGFGRQNGQHWSGVNEQEAFASVSISPYRPGEILARLVPSGKQHDDMDILYRRTKRNATMRKRVQEAKFQILKLREERSRQEGLVDGEPVQVVLLDNSERTIEELLPAIA